MSWNTRCGMPPPAPCAQRAKAPTALSTKAAGPSRCGASSPPGTSFLSRIRNSERAHPLPNERTFGAPTSERAPFRKGGRPLLFCFVLLCFAPRGALLASVLPARAFFCTEAHTFSRSAAHLCAVHLDR